MDASPLYPLNNPMADVGALFSRDLYLMPLLEVDYETPVKYYKP
jgi:hypothetical protein